MIIKASRYSHGYVTAPFRLDLVMCGVGDLGWFADKDSDCLSACCNFTGASIMIEVKFVPNSSTIELYGFGTQPKYVLPLDELSVNIVKQTPQNVKLIISAITIAVEILNKACTPIHSGVRIINKSKFVKGMGGSSVIAASVISLLCKTIGGIDFELNELAYNVVHTESLAGIGGGWEDVAGVVNPGINRIKYRPLCKKALSLESIACSDAIVSALSRNLLVVDSMINASTSTILSAAKERYGSFPQLVIENTNKLRVECETVTSALQNGNIDSIGASLLRQRQYWNTITGGVSANPIIDTYLCEAKPFITGYREAGAGGGGTILVMCKQGKTEDVSNIFKKQGLPVHEWHVAANGINVVCKEA